MDMKRNNYKRFKARFVVFILAIIALGGLVTMLLWNALIPAIFGLKAITFFQALGLLVLSRILFGNFPGRRFGGGNERRRHWRHKMKEKWENMSPEERAAMKDRWRKKWDWKEDSEDKDEQAN